MTIVSFDPTLLLSFYQAQLPAAPSGQAAAAGTGTTPTSTTQSATANDSPPWDATPPAQAVARCQGSLDDEFSRHEQGAARCDRDRRRQDRTGQPETLLALHGGEHAGLSGQDGAARPARRRPAGRPQHAFPDRACNRSRITSPTRPSTISPCRPRRRPHPSPARRDRHSVRSPTTRKRSSATPTSTAPLPGLSASDSFTIAVKKGGATTNVAIDLSQVQGG